MKIRLVDQDIVEFLEDCLFGFPFGMGNFRDEQSLGQFQDFFLSVGKFLVSPDAVQLLENRGNFTRITGANLFIVFTLPATPRCNRTEITVSLFEDIEDLRDLLLADKGTEADLGDIVDRNHDGHVTVNNSQHVKFTLDTRELTRFNSFDDTDTLGGINGHLANTETGFHFSLHSNTIPQSNCLVKTNLPRNRNLGHRPISRGNNYARHFLILFCLTSILLLALALPARAEPPHPLSFAKDLETNDEYRLALLEYKRTLRTSLPEPMIAAAQLGIARCYLELGDWKRGEDALQKLLEDHPTAPESVPATLLLADIPFFRGDFSRARANYRQLQHSWSETVELKDQINWRIAWSYIEQGDLAPARHTLGRLQDPAARLLSDELLQLDQRPHYSPGLAGTLSAVLPGAGQLYTGHPRSACLALLLNVAFLAASLEAFDQEMPVLGGILLAVEIGWYGGNIYNALNLAERNNHVSLEKGRRDLRNRFGLSFGVDKRSGWLQLEGHF
ncbi:MAG: hypothetical protein C0616_05900 [Desulfuromonas sp.]|nr:MAG: hypothetical protein C0616_05900 [Desulfuromonas sp.]